MQFRRCAKEQAIHVGVLEVQGFLQPIHRELAMKCVNTIAEPGLKFGFFTSELAGPIPFRRSAQSHDISQQQIYLLIRYAQRRYLGTLQLCGVLTLPLHRLRECAIERLQSQKQMLSSLVQ
jgi:hypothetical protein